MTRMTIWGMLRICWSSYAIVCCMHAPWFLREQCRIQSTQVVQSRRNLSSLIGQPINLFPKDSNGPSPSAPCTMLSWNPTLPWSMYPAWTLISFTVGIGSIKFPLGFWFGLWPFMPQLHIFTWLIKMAGTFKSRFLGNDCLFSSH